MTNSERVVIKTAIAIRQSAGSDIVAARLSNLGLTAYGYTEEEAKKAVKHLFNKFVNAHREHGDLEAHLNAIKVDWDWETQYDFSDMPYEVTEPFPNNAVQASSVARASAAEEEEAADEPLALAA